MSKEREWKGVASVTIADLTRWRYLYTDTTAIYTLADLEARSLKRRCRQGRAPCRGSVGPRFIAFLVSGTRGPPQLMAAGPQPLASHSLSSVSMSPLLIGMLVIGFRAHHMIQDDLILRSST